MFEAMRLHMRIMASSLALLPLAACGALPPREDRLLPSFSKAVADDIVFEIDPRIELLSGVQSMTSWVVSGRGPVSRNAYYEGLKALFGAVSGGAAVRESEALTRRGFTYDAPPAMALSLDGGEAFKAPAEGWSDYLKGRAGGTAPLEKLRASLAQAYDEVGFRDFLGARAEDYRRWIDETSEGFDAERISAWLGEFYGPDLPPMYHFVLAPAMFPGGGYGFSRSVGEGSAKRLHVYQIVRAQGAPDGNPGFPAGKSLASLALHEFGHSFVKPALERSRFDSRLNRIFEPVKKRMQDMAYGQAKVFFNELVVRAATIIGERDLGQTTAAGAEGRIRTEELAGFYPIRRVIALLEEYRANRAAYPDFNAFCPVLLRRLAEESDAIVAEGSKMPLASWTQIDISPVPSFKEGFEGSVEGTAPRGFAIKIGSYLQGAEGGPSRLSIDSASPSSGASLRLDADADTSSWLYLSKPVSVRPGELSASFKSKAEGIRKEGSQFGGSYVGFILEGPGGKKTFAVRILSGSFDWSGFEVSTRIDPKEVRSIDFAVFLNESGTLWVDEIEVAYR
jgi:hypothetical protein